MINAFNLDINHAITLLKPLLLFVLGITFYSVFIFKFYRFLGKRDIFKLDLNKYNTASHPLLQKFLEILFYFLEHIILLPLFIFFWFGVLAVLLMFLSKGVNIENILLVSMAVIGAIRITAYYNEDLSRDLSKMLPFALLGVFLVDITSFSFSESISLVKEIPSQIEILAYYLLFVMALEIILRFCHGLYSSFFCKKDK